MRNLDDADLGSLRVEGTEDVVDIEVFGAVNTMVADYLASHLNRGDHPRRSSSAALVQQSLLYGCTVGFWWTAGIFAAGAVVCGSLLRRGPLIAGRMT